MSIRAKLLIACLLTLVLTGGLLFFFLHGTPSVEQAEENPAPGAAPLAQEALPDRASKVRAVPREKAAAAAKKTAAAPVGRALLPGEGWTLSGRIVREAGPGGGDTATVPVAGAAIHLNHHPRRTRPEEAPPPVKKVTGPDGLFEIPGIPGRMWLRLEIDEPSSAYRTLSFQLSEPRGDARRDLGDVLIEPAAKLWVRLVGPKDEPIEKGSLLVGRSSQERSAYLSGLGFHESRQEMEERAKGEYVLERAPLASLYVQAGAPGYAPSGRNPVDLPRNEPLVIRLEEGRQIAGSVHSSGEMPIEKADLEATRSSSGGEVPPKVETDAAGHFLFDSLAEGDYTLTASAEGFVSAQRSGVATGTLDLAFSLLPEAVFSGRVIAEEGEKPVARAKVTLKPSRGASFSADSDAQGLFKVRKIAAGSYAVQVDHPEFAALNEEARELKEGETLGDQVLKLAQGFSAGGKVVDTESQAGISDAQVTFQLQGKGGSAVRRTTRTGPQGTFEVKGLREGTYSLSAAARGYFSSKGRLVPVGPDAEKDFDVALEQGSSISGKVLNLAGSPVAGALVRPNLSVPNGGGNQNQEVANLANQLYSLSAQSDAEGRYKLEGLPPLIGYVVSASHRDHADGSVKGLTLGRKESLEEIDIRLPRGGTVRGRVLDETGQGIAGASLSTSRQRAPEDEDRNFLGYSAGVSVTSDAEGNYTISRLEAGTYTVRAQARDRMAQSRDEVQVAEERVTEGIDIVLAAGEALAGRVVDVEGNAVSAADVRASGGGSAQARTDTEGRFLLRGLRAGQVSLSVGKSGFDGQGLQVTAPAKDLVVTLIRAARISGTVRARGHDTFQGFQVVAVRQEGPGKGGRSYGNSQGDPGGRFEIEVGAGTYILQAMVPGFAPSRSAPITVKAGEVVEGLWIDLQSGGTIQGTVVAAATGQPVEGAAISLVPSGNEPWNIGWGMPGTRSGPDGSFTLEGLPEGTLGLSATHAKYAQANLTGISVRAGSSTGVRIELGMGGAIQGLVTQAGSPLPGARVQAFRSEGVSYVGKDGTSNAEGRFEIKGLPAGEYFVQVKKPGRRSSFRNRATVQVIEGQTSEVTIDEGAGAVRLTGVVTSGGSPVGGGEISAIQPEKGMDGANARIDGSGRYSLDLPGPGTYQVVVETRGRGGMKVEVTIPEGAGDLRQDLELPSGELAGAVVDAETGAPVPRAQVMAFAGGIPRSFFSLFRAMQSMARTDDQGRFLLQGLGDGSYTLRAFAPGYADGRLEGFEVGGRSREARLALERGIGFRAQVVDWRGQPVPQAMAFLRDQAGELVMFANPGITDPQGLVELVARPGTYRLTALHRSFAPSTVTIRVEAETAEPTLVLKPGGKVQVQVLSSRARLVSGAEIEILNEKGDNVVEERALFAMMGTGASAMTGQGGSLVLDQVAPGTYRAVARMGKARSREESVSVSEGQVSEVRLVLSE